jgi:hypothetical protein
VLDSTPVDTRTPPPLLVVATAVLGIATALLLWFWHAAYGISVPAFLRAIDAARVHPLVSLWVLHYAFLLLTAAVLAVKDGAQRGLSLASRGAWAIAILVLGVLGVWAYLARRSGEVDP